MLPVPELAETCALYLKSLEGLVNAEEYTYTPTQLGSCIFLGPLPSCFGCAASRAFYVTMNDHPYRKTCRLLQARLVQRRMTITFSPIRLVFVGAVVSMQGFMRSFAPCHTASCLWSAWAMSCRTATTLKLLIVFSCATTPFKATGIRDHAPVRHADRRLICVSVFMVQGELNLLAAFFSVAYFLAIGAPCA